ncbi:MAG: RNHCP domain-containing protein [Spirochaetaceae bacterium]|nr:MAG: RNHCP domain-containing protein [Spirochaetaceae bacterium]
MSRRAVTYHTTQETFVCIKCAITVAPPENGTHNRNHCPYCLSSRHVDLRPGDRRSGCRAEMEAIGVHVQADGEWSIIHRCTGCGILKLNRIGPDDSERALLALAARPLTRLPFPLEALTAGGVNQ